MANRLLTVEEVNTEFIKPMAEFLKSLPVQQQRAFVYDMQTSCGGFPSSEKERKRFIKTGKLHKEKRKKKKWWRGGD